MPCPLPGGPSPVCRWRGMLWMQGSSASAGRWLLPPCPAGGQGCGRWAQPWADTGTGTEPWREEHSGGPSSPHGLGLLLVCVWTHGPQQSCCDLDTALTTARDRSHQRLSQAKEPGLPQRLLKASPPWRWSFCTACHWSQEGEISMEIPPPLKSLELQFSHSKPALQGSLPFEGSQD